MSAYANTEISLEHNTNLKVLEIGPGIEATLTLLPQIPSISLEELHLVSLQHPPGDENFWHRLSDMLRGPKFSELGRVVIWHGKQSVDETLIQTALQFSNMGTLRTVEFMSTGGGMDSFLPTFGATEYRRSLCQMFLHVPSAAGDTMFGASGEVDHVSVPWSTL